MSTPAKEQKQGKPFKKASERRSLQKKKLVSVSLDEQQSKLLSAKRDPKR